MTKEIMMKTFVAVMASLALAAIGVPAAHAEFSIIEFGGAATSQGQLSRQAGEHADLTTKLRFSSLPGDQNDGEVRTVKVDLPPGVVGNPTAAATCSSVQLVAGVDGKGSICP